MGRVTPDMLSIVWHEHEGLSIQRFVRDKMISKKITTLMKKETAEVAVTFVQIFISMSNHFHPKNANKPNKTLWTLSILNSDSVHQPVGVKLRYCRSKD